ncbi:oxygenase MpaB family protein [Algoriphagus sediminis]|uniref:Oxygenase MpaB family protein n=1 Tax=Algoriphagus sediminis TaxID=3057113 RepID=A0ABT7YD80_9BACT|nr:oxygenase MpaB family protein [Algoriphagus sediminis]MDN3204466.1 oxygenase MpaB family protein [Algoriphagus sediminis]
MNKLRLYTDDNLNSLRKRQDVLADPVAGILVNRPDLCEQINSWQVIPEVYPSDLPSDVAAYFDFFKAKEAKAPLETLQKGQEFFSQKGDLYLAMLGFYSLPYCYAFADGAQVLIRSKRIIENIGERLGETGSFLLSLFKSGAFYENSEAYLVCAKVRLVHAFSRYFIKIHSKDWNEDLGEPINQEDLIGTNLAFSLMVLRGMRKLNQEASPIETIQILNYWSWIGDLLGLNIGYWPETPKESFELEKLIRKRHLKFSEAGERLTRALISFYQETIPEPLLAKEAESIISFFIGEEASKAVGIKQRISIDGNILGLFLKIMGLRSFGAGKSYKGIESEFKKNQIEQFGTVLQVSLPVIMRS